MLNITLDDGTVVPVKNFTSKRKTFILARSAAEFCQNGPTLTYSIFFKDSSKSVVTLSHKAKAFALCQRLNEVFGKDWKKLNENRAFVLNNFKPFLQKEIQNLNLLAFTFADQSHTVRYAKTTEAAMLSKHPALL